MGVFLTVKSSTVFYFGYALFLICVCACEATAQNLVASPVAPPPLRLLNFNERAQLSQENDAKKHLKLNVELASERLRRAEDLAAARRFEAVTDELASYQSILEEAFSFMQARGKVDNKTRDLYKYLELQMRAQGPRLEAIRRLTPAEYAGYVRAVFEFTRDARTEALNSFYGDTVIRDLKPQKLPPSQPKGETAGSTLPTQPKEP